MDGDVDGDVDSDADGDGDADSDGDGDEDVETHWSVCTMPSDCVLRTAGCCAPCGAPSVDDVDGVRSDRTAAHHAEVCPEEPVGGCPLCPSQLNPWLFAFCIEDTCTAVDLRLRELTTCDEDDDCHLRVRDCCECGADMSIFNIVAVAEESLAAFADRVCDPGTGCDACVPEYPGTVEAYCTDEGHCDVRSL